MSLYKLGTILITVLLTSAGCMESGATQVQKPVKKEPATKDATSGDSAMPSSTPDPFANDTVTISCNSCVSTVKLNQSITWQFSAISTSGVAVEINKISSLASINDFVVTGSTVKFTPRQASEMNGSLKVDAINNGKAYSQTFSWGGSGTTGGNQDFLKTIGGVLVQVLSNTGSDDESDDSEDY